MSVYHFNFPKAGFKATERDIGVNLTNGDDTASDQRIKPVFLVHNGAEMSCFLVSPVWGLRGSSFLHTQSGIEVNRDHMGSAETHECHPSLFRYRNLRSHQHR